MQLYLLRHADAETVALRDDDRTLSEKGLEQARRVARFCEAQKIRPDVILCSPLIRAQQTAKPVADLLKVELITESYLSCGMHPEGAEAQLKGYAKFESVMMVGHEPDLSCLAAHFLGLPDNGNILIKKASLTLIQLHRIAPGAGTLLFSVPARFV